MENTEVIIDIAKFKNAIKIMVKNQRSYKNQRKTVNIIGERIMSTSDATYKHYVNREDLRIMYAAYGIARGKTFSEIENRYSEERHPLNHRKLEIDRVLTTFRTLKVDSFDVVDIAV